VWGGLGCVKGFAEVEVGFDGVVLHAVGTFLVFKCI
jgi:hypothetical protein